MACPLTYTNTYLLGDRRHLGLETARTFHHAGFLAFVERPLLGRKDWLKPIFLLFVDLLNAIAGEATRSAPSVYACLCSRLLLLLESSPS